MAGLTPAQLKALSDFANTVAAAWFTAGVIAPMFVTKAKTLEETILFPFIGILMTGFTLGWSLSLVQRLE